MKLAEFSVNRRVTVLMMTIIILILGLISLTKLGLEMLPDMDFPVISIITNYPGASSEDIEEVITKPIERVIAGVKDVNSVKSDSIEGVSLIMVEFAWGTNLDFAAQDLRDAIDQITDYLPRDVSRPSVYKFNLAELPVLNYGVTGATNTYELRKILDEEVANRLKHLGGVASVSIMGGDQAEIKVLVDKDKLDFHGIGINEVMSVIAASNLNVAAGHLQQRKNEFLVRTTAEFLHYEEIRELPLKTMPTGSKVYVKDVAEVKFGFHEKRYSVRTNKSPTALLMVSKESGANTLSVSNMVKNEIDRIQSEYNGEIIFTEIMDLGLPIKNVTEGAASNLLVGGLLAILIMFIFLRNWRPTLVISLAIPISVIATFMVIYLADFSLNIMTIGGLALGVGMLVDNSIVVIENIYRHIEMGKDRKEAAKIGASEVGMAITASTLTTIAVFFPMIFSEGMTGILVRGLALTVAFSLFASLFVALTIVPALSSTIFKSSDKTNVVKESQRWFVHIREKYLKILSFVLRHRGKTLLAVLLLLIISFGLIPIIGTEFMPTQDIPFLTLNVKMPVGTVMEETNLLVEQLEEVFMNTPGVRDVFAIVGPMTEAQADPSNPQDVSEAQVIGRLYQQKDRDLSYEQIREIIRSQIPHVDGAQFIFLSQADMMGGGSSYPLVINIFGQDLQELSALAGVIESRIMELENIDDVVNSMKEGRPEIHIRIDKDKAFNYGLTAAQIATAVNTATLGSVAGIYRYAGEEIDIRVRLKEEHRQTLEDILSIPLTSPLGVNVPLNTLAEISYETGPVKITHENQTRKATVQANIVGTSDLGGTVRDVRNYLSDVTSNLRPGYFIEFAGSYKDMQEAFVTLTLALLLAIVLVYSVMASQFESLKQPFIVMFTMPLAIIGVLFILAITGTTLSVASFVGIIILAGIVVNNGIVLIDHTNQLRNQGMEKHQALLKAGSDRIRPVLITAITTMMGMVPMAFSTGEGSEMKSPMALTVIGGLISATFLTLLVIPVVYSLIDKISYKNYTEELDITTD